MTYLQCPKTDCKATIAIPGATFTRQLPLAKSKTFNWSGNLQHNFLGFQGTFDAIMTEMVCMFYLSISRYAWTIMQCKMCKGHLGWQFTSKSLSPSSFYGLAKSSFDIKIDGGEEQEWPRLLLILRLLLCIYIFICVVFLIKSFFQYFFCWFVCKYLLKQGRVRLVRSYRLNGLIINYP